MIQAHRVSRKALPMAQRHDRKRLGKKHRQASTRPKKGRAPRTTPTTGAVASPQAQGPLHQARRAREEEAHPHPLARARDPQTIAPNPASSRTRTTPSAPPALSPPTRRQQPALLQHRPPNPPPKPAPGATPNSSPPSSRLAADSAASRALPLIAICGRPNVGKSTLFNRLTGSRRSIVGDEPGITRDRIYGLIEWQSAEARIVDTGGIVPDDAALIPAEIFRQAQVALAEAAAIIMVVDGRTELAPPTSPSPASSSAAASPSSSPSTRSTPKPSPPPPKTSAASASATSSPSPPSTAPASATCSTRSSPPSPLPPPSHAHAHRSRESNPRLRLQAQLLRSRWRH